MPRTGRVIALILAADLGWAGAAHAAHRHHKPWLMVKSARAREATRSRAEIESRSTAAAPRAAAAPQPVVAADPLPSAGNTYTTGDQVASQALRYKGSRYRFGGTSKRGLDCSGLVTRVFEDLKLKKIPRASNALYKAGKPVALSDLRPGDLVFFKNTYRWGISHVGVYAGHNKFVHASDRRHGVIVTPLSDPYYQLHYAGARRLY